MMGKISIPDGKEAGFALPIAILWPLSGQEPGAVLMWRQEASMLH